MKTTFLRLSSTFFRFPLLQGTYIVYRHACKQKNTHAENKIRLEILKRFLAMTMAQSTMLKVLSLKITNFINQIYFKRKPLYLLKKILKYFFLILQNNYIFSSSHSFLEKFLYSPSCSILRSWPFYINCYNIYTCTYLFLNKSTKFIKSLKYGFTFERNSRGDFYNTECRR